MNCFISNLYRAGKGRIVLMAIVLTSLAALSANSLPEMTGWPRIHRMKMEDEMEEIR